MTYASKVAKGMKRHSDWSEPDEWEVSWPRHGTVPRVTLQKRTHTSVGHEEVDADGDLDAWVIPATSKPKSLRSIREVESRFIELRDAWAPDVLYTSSLLEVCMHPAYQQVIGLGPQALGSILVEVQGGEYRWFWALVAIAGEDVAVGAETPAAAAARWLRWGSERGLLALESVPA